MKNYSLILLALTACLQLNSQIAVTSASYPNVGDFPRFSNSNDFAIDYTFTGPNSTWDYSNLQASSQKIIEYFGPSDLTGIASVLYGSFAPTKYKTTTFYESNDIPFAQISQFLPVSIDKLYLYNRKTTDSLTNIGLSLIMQGLNVPFRSDTVDKEYDYPLNFGNAYTSRSYTNMDLNPIQDAIWRRYRQRSSEVDGWGSITTPYGTFNALRIHHVITEQDSIYYDFGNGGTWISIPVPVAHEYVWLSDTERFPLLTIRTSELAGQEQATNVQYRDNYVLGFENLELSQVDVYPNPCTDIVIIESNKEGILNLMSADGKVIESQSLNSYNYFDTSDLSQGVYYIKIESDKGNEIFKVVKN